MNLKYDSKNANKIYSQSLVNCNDISHQFNENVKKLLDYKKSTKKFIEIDNDLIMHKLIQKEKHGRSKSEDNKKIDDHILFDTQKPKIRKNASSDLVNR